MRRVLALALAAPAIVACAGDDTEVPQPVDASLPPEASVVGIVDASGAFDAGAGCAAVELDAALFGVDGQCDRYMKLPCGAPDVLRGYQCDPDIDLCTAVCPSKFFFTCVYPSVSCEDGGLLADADVVVECNTCLGNIGRRTRGLRAPGPVGNGAKRAVRATERRVPAGLTVAEYLAGAAYLEAASIDAFRELGARLAAHAAPAKLRRAAARAVADEERHARVTTKLARAFGTQPEAPPPHRATRATLETLATENAVEGCVRESMGALVAAHQAACATDPRVAKAMRRIARDEARHAALAWAIDAWAAARLRPAARARVNAAKIEALAALRKDAARPVPKELVSLAGVPSSGAAACIVTAFERVFLTS